jgi:L-ascorbate metabolism protein UlaG (beta-lactamase superfamily)
MHISWLGQTCVKLQTKNMDKDVLLLIDAYKPEQGDFPRSFSPDIALFSGGGNNVATLSQDPFVINTFGEFEIKNVIIYSLPGGENNLVFKFGAENMTIVHLGKLTKNLENGNLEKILNPDILFVPIGGEPNYLDNKTILSLITSLEPRVIIPIGYKCDTEPNAKAISAFVSEIGLKPETTGKKIIIKAKDLPQEETKLIILEKE